jgi:hypothetical protein
LEHQRAREGEYPGLRGMEAVIPTDLSTPPIALDVAVVLLLLAAVVLLLVAVRLIRIRLRNRREENRELPPLIYPVRRQGGQRPAMQRPDGPWSETKQADGPTGEHVTYNSTAPAVRIVREAAEPAPPPEAGSVEGRSEPVEGRNQPIHGQSEPVDRPGTDETLQLLPGRLEPVDRGAEQEIRFVRVPGMNRFTLGRNSGPVHSHIQLRAATASRMHAFMIFEDGRWQLGNMSETNAVVINGSPLNGGPHLLEEGDRIEFGELTFVFRER